MLMQKFDVGKERSAMQQLAARLVICTAITAIGLWGADTLTGTWKLNLAKSTNTSTNPATNRTDVYETAADGWIKVTTTQQRANGAADNYSYSLKTDGKEYPVTGGSFDTISVKRIDANTTSFEVIKKADGT